MQASSDNGLLVRHWYQTDTSPASQPPAITTAHQSSPAVNHLYRVRPQTDITGHCPRPMFTNNGHVIQRGDDSEYATTARSLSYNAVSINQRISIFTLEYLTSLV